VKAFAAVGPGRVKSMCHELLEQLREEHRDVERHLLKVEEQCEAMERGDQPDLAVLYTVAAYLAGDAMREHHARENRLVRLLGTRLPHFAEEILDVTRDHEQSRRAIGRYTQALEQFENAKCDRVALAHIARAMVGNERGHFIAEEEVFFPYVAGHIKNDECLAAMHTDVQKI